MESLNRDNTAIPLDDMHWQREQAFEALITTGEDPVAYNQHEAWQYMGTWKTDGILKHEFRHRCHPSNNHRKYLHLPVQ